MFIRVVMISTMWVDKPRPIGLDNLRSLLVALGLELKGHMTSMPRTQWAVRGGDIEGTVGPRGDARDRPNEMLKETERQSGGK